jgi:hypothetical protein
MLCHEEQDTRIEPASAKPEWQRPVTLVMAAEELTREDGGDGHDMTCCHSA